MNKIIETLAMMYPNAHAELNFNNNYQLIIAVVLSAQTTDKRVNEVTKILFPRYPDFEALSKADISEVEKLIYTIGMYHNKAQNIINLAKNVITKYDGVLPSELEELISLPGVGTKTAAVVRIEGFNIPDFPVDTHVSRVAKRLGLASIDDTPIKVANKLKKWAPDNTWRALHHQMIFHGRYCCHSQRPECDNCKLKFACCYIKD